MWNMTKLATISYSILFIIWIITLVTEQSKHWTIGKNAVVIEKNDDYKWMPYRQSEIIKKKTFQDVFG